MKTFALCLALAAVAAAGTFAVAQDAAPAKPAAPTRILNVPDRPFDIVERFFNLAPAEQDAMRTIQEKYRAEERAAMEKILAGLDAKYRPEVLATVHEDVRPIVKGVFAAVDAYHESLKAADDDFRAAWKKITGKDLVAIPRSELGILREFPAVDATKLRDAERSVFRDTFAQMQKVAEERGIKRPQGRDRNAWGEYFQKTAGIREEVGRKLETAKLDELKAGLDAAQAKQVDALVAAYQARESKQTMAMEMLAATLADLVDPQKLTDAGRGFGFGNRGNRGNRGGRGGNGGAPRNNAPRQ